MVARDLNLPRNLKNSSNLKNSCVPNNLFFSPVFIQILMQSIPTSKSSLVVKRVMEYVHCNTWVKKKIEKKMNGIIIIEF